MNDLYLYPGKNTGIKNFWETKITENDKTKKYEVYEVDNGFIVKITECIIDEKDNRTSKSVIKIATENPILTEEQKKKKDQGIDLEGMLSVIAAQTGKFLVR